MENAVPVAELMNAAATLLWPCLAIVVVLMFRDQVAKLLDTARSRRFTVKVAGNELTMEEASEQQQKLLSALQGQILLLQERLDRVASPTGEAKFGLEPTKPSAILWVDDNPKNNATIVAHIRGLGIQVDQARSTSEALSKFEPGRHDRVVTDMGRLEGGGYIRDAGLELLRQVKQLQATVPVIIYTGRRGVEEFGRAALSAGAKVVTDTPIVLLEALDLKSLRASGKSLDWEGGVAGKPA